MKAQITDIVLVGHCGPDMFFLRSAIRHFGLNVALHSANDERTLREHAAPTALLLVNRVLDGRFNDSDGIALVRRLAAHDDPPTLMLVSNYAHAQQQAVEAGAVPGFGKSELGSDKAQQRLRDAVGLVQK